MSRWKTGMTRGSPERVDSEDQLEDPLLSSTLGSSSEEDVLALRKAGRAAKASGTAVEATRRKEAWGGTKKMALAGLEVGLDMALPGAGYAVSALSTVSAVRDAKNEGRGLAETGVGEAMWIGAGFIPVVGEFTAFADGLFTTVRALSETRSHRTATKLKKVEQLLEDGRAHLRRIEEIRPSIEAGGDEKLIGMLDKAERRIVEAMGKAQAWVGKKSDHMHLPLASAAATDDFADFDDAFGEET